jgi:hypothetical protein
MSKYPDFKLFVASDTSAYNVWSDSKEVLESQIILQSKHKRKYGFPQEHVTAKCFVRSTQFRNWFTEWRDTVHRFVECGFVLFHIACIIRMMTALMKEAVRTSETLAYFKCTCYILESCRLHTRRPENLNTHIHLYYG